MKAKILLFCTLFFMVINMGYSQKKKYPQNIIDGKVNITKYHSRADLDRMSKAELLDLYIERIEVIVNILPNIAFATKPGVTMWSLGIPDTKDNRRALEANKQASTEYFESTIEFQKKILPYSDTSDLIAAILFYEDTLKSLHTYDEFKN
ncbi:MAG: hypothetical protein HKN99_10980 [Winogradskyella sp.]|nr:hypothetical protein [Bacteroidia bacterium]NNC46395.1 hypothetical protein [Winogradskyella sp.]NNF86069.1 hypothetical protein [Winogradskyella sp.]NNK39398.1 hypothetical protein [Winogradskyella sp.]